MIIISSEHSRHHHIIQTFSIMMTMMTSYYNSHIMIFSYNPSIQRLRVRTQVISSRFSSFLWSDWDIHYHDISWLQPDHAAQIYNSVIVLFGWNNSCSCRWTTMNCNQLCASVLTGQLPNTIMKIHVLNQTVGPKYLKMEQFISLWEICENWTISSFWPFWRLSASTLVSEKEQGVARTDELLLYFL